MTASLGLVLAESDPDRRKAWIAAVDTIEALDPSAVISGQKCAGRADDALQLSALLQDRFDLESDLDLVADHHAAAVKWHVELDPEVGPADLGSR